MKKFNLTEIIKGNKLGYQAVLIALSKANWNAGTTISASPLIKPKKAVNNPSLDVLSLDDFRDLAQPEEFNQVQEVQKENTIQVFVRIFLCEFNIHKFINFFVANNLFFWALWNFFYADGAVFNFDFHIFKLDCLFSFLLFIFNDTFRRKVLFILLLQLFNNRIVWIQMFLHTLNLQKY